MGYIFALFTVCLLDPVVFYAYLLLADKDEERKVAIYKSRFLSG